MWHVTQVIVRDILHRLLHSAGIRYIGLINTDKQEEHEESLARHGRAVTVLTNGLLQVKMRGRTAAAPFNHPLTSSRRTLSHRRDKQCKDQMQSRVISTDGSH